MDLVTYIIKILIEFFTEYNFFIDFSSYLFKKGFKLKIAKDGDLQKSIMQNDNRKQKYNRKKSSPLPSLSKMQNPENEMKISFLYILFLKFKGFFCTKCCEYS